MMKSEQQSPFPMIPPTAAADGPVRRAWQRLLRLESVLLLVGLACTVYGKFGVLRQRGDAGGWALLGAVLSDLAFFGGAAVLFDIIRAGLPKGVATRLPVLAALLLCAWSAANLSWLIATGVQIHIAVFSSLYHDPGEFGGIILNRLSKARSFTLTLFGAAITLGAVVVFRLVQPEALSAKRIQGIMPIRRWRTIVPVAALVVGLTAPRFAASADPRIGAISYSSHWFALASLVGFDGSSRPDQSTAARRIARQGDRAITPPPADAPKPHVILVVLESTALWSTSLGRGTAGETSTFAKATPALEELARQGVWFERTRAVVTHTTQSQFSLLTGVCPSMAGDFVEAVLLDTPYETLATILRVSGYRTRFSQMVRASFECNPGLVTNMGFESFWAREDANAPASHLGYFAGDDFKMLDPAFAWLDERESPALLFLMTSVAHHPYEVPSWYGPEMTDVEQAYLQTVRYTDDFVAEVVARLKERGLFEDTIVCVVADHGEGVGRNGVMQHNNNPFEEALRVPWIITWPRRIAGGKVVRENCTLMDVTPTLLALLGYGTAGAGFEGMDVLGGAAALGKVPSNRRLPFHGWYKTAPSGYVEGDAKLIYWPNLGKAFRFDLAADPDEKMPIELEGRESDELRRLLADWRSRCRISFHPKRYRERLLFDRWQTFALGDMAWCYYVADEAEARE